MVLFLGPLSIYTHNVANGQIHIVSLKGLEIGYGGPSQVEPFLSLPLVCFNSLGLTLALIAITKIK